MILGIIVFLEYRNEMKQKVDKQECLSTKCYPEHIDWAA